MIEHAPDDPKDLFDLATEPDATFLNEISAAALTRLLIQKGIFTPDEILQQERELRLHDLNHSNENHDCHRRHSSRLRRLASQRRWSRKITHFFLGWEWKRAASKKNNQDLQT